MKTFRNIGIGIGAALWAVLGWGVLTHAAALDSVPVKTLTATPAAIAIMADDATSSTITSTQSISRVNPVAIAISAHYTLPVTQVVALHNSGYGYGEIVKLFQFALVSGKSVTEVQQMRESGMGWGQISKALNLPRGAGKVSIGTIMRAHKRTPGGQGAQKPSADHKVKPKVVKPKGNGNVNRRTVSRVKSRVTAPKGVKPARAKKGR